MRFILAKLTVILAVGSTLGSAASAETIEEKAATCAACHGEAGVPIDPKIPIIWGQHAGYSYLQLKDMKSGLRKNEIMQPLLEPYSKADLLALAEYFAAKPWPATGYQFKDAGGEAGKANQIEVAGQCTACHQEGYVGDSVQPRLAGQNVEYLIKTTQDFKTKERANNTFMNDMLKTFSDEDIALISRFTAAPP
jgi:cytochrome c553